MPIFPPLSAKGAPTAVVGLSGGVDSAVAALLLRRAGVSVVGVYMVNWDPDVNGEVLGRPSDEGVGCSSKADYEDAKAVAAQLGIPLIRANFVKEYWEGVFAPAVEAYKKGDTPNPDVACNAVVKFGALRKFLDARFPGAYYATGHYAKVVHGPDGPRLYLCADASKDQTYFLCGLRPKQLERVVFPLADLTKPQVRAIAKRHGLAVAGKKDSTGVCFIGERQFKRFLQNYIAPTPGPMLLVPEMQRIGLHDGLPFYTLGQSRGINAGGQPERTFVVGKDAKTNALLVAHASRADEYLVSEAAVLKDVNWLTEKPTGDWLIGCHLRFRHRQPLIAGHAFSLPGGDAGLWYPGGADAVTPGQYAAAYSADGRLLLGGKIKSSARARFGIK